MDSQCEARSEYYASLAIDIELPLEGLTQYLRENDGNSEYSWRTCLTVDILEELAKRNYRDAREILCDYLGWGQ